MAGLVVAGIAAVTFFTIRTGTGSGPTTKPSQPTAVPATTKAPSGPTAELVSLLGRPQAVNVEVAYTGTDVTSAPVNAHLWRRGPLARLDTESGSGDATMRASQLLTSSGPLSCTQAASAPWSCAPKPGLGVGDIGVVSPALVNTLSALQVSVRDDRVVGQAVRCFTVAIPTASTDTTAPAGDVAGLCLTSDGIAVRVDLGATHLEAVSLNRGRPPDSVFQAPA